MYKYSDAHMYGPCVIRLTMPAVDHVSLTISSENFTIQAMS